MDRCCTHISERAALSRLFACYSGSDICVSVSTAMRRILDLSACRGISSMSLQMALPQLRQLEVLHLDGNPEVGLGALCHHVHSPLGAELSFVWLPVYRCFALWLLWASGPELLSITKHHTSKEFLGC